MSRARGASTALVFVMLIAARGAADSGEEQVPVGPRPLALGGAFVAVAEGTDAVYWNAAGLGRLRVSSVRATNSELHGVGIHDNVVTLVSPVGGRFGAGIEWHNSRFKDSEIEDSLNRFSFGLGWRAHRLVAVGSVLKYRRYEQVFESIEQGTGSGWGFDLGVLVQAHRHVSIGANLRDVGGSTLDFGGGVTSRPFDPEFVVGTAVRAHRLLLLTADVGREAHAGAEFHVFDALSLRAGWTKDFQGLDASRWSAGLGVRFGAAAAEYTFQGHPMLDATHRFALKLDFSLAPQLVEIHDAGVQPLFASFYKSYAVHAPATLTVTNVHDAPLQVHVRVDHESLLDKPTEKVVLLKPGVAQEVRVPIVFSQRIVEVDETLPVTLSLELSYVSSGRRRTEKRELQTVVYERGTLEWSEGVAKAAAFVTPSDDAVDRFTRDIVRATVNQEAGFLNRTTSLAVRLFNGMSACGLTYAPDPLNPYAEVQGKTAAVDNIQYPAELLASRVGDCDDSTVLYASMLANVGIRTAFVDVPGHVFLMFDTQIHARDRRMLGVDPDLFVEREGTLWIPVETTSLGQPFHVAWQSGAALVHQWESTDRFEVVDVQRARQRYVAAVGAAVVVDQPAAPAVERAVVVDYLGRDLEALTELRRAHLEATYRALDEDDATQRLELARAHYLNRNYARARQELERIAAAHRGAAYWNNLGNVQWAQGDVAAARISYTRARGSDPMDPGITLNRGLALHVLGARAESRVELQAAVTSAGSVADAMGLFGLKSSEAPLAARGSDALALQQMSWHAIEGLLRDAAMAAGLEAVVDSVQTDPGARGARVDADTMAESLYWKSAPQPGSTQPTPQEIVSRFPTLECPDRVHLETEFALQVSLTESLVTPEVEIVSGQGPTLEVPVGVLDVVLSAPGFRFRNGANTASITVRRRGDSIPAVFYLTALAEKASTRPIYVTFWHDGGFLGKVVRHVEVAGAPTVVAQPPAASQEPAQPTVRLSQGKRLRIFTEVEIPDLTLWLMDYRQYADDVPLHVIVESPELAATDASFEFPDGTAQWLRSQFGRFAARSGRGVTLAGEADASPQATVDLMRGFGRELYSRHAPKAFKRAFWKLVDKLGDDFETIQIYTNNPLLPWELMIPSRQDASDERDFLGTQFRIARWHILADDDSGLMDHPPRDLTMNELVVIAPRYDVDRLPAQEAELQALEAMDGYRRVPGNYEAVRQLFGKLPNGIVHFAGHGEVQRTAEGTYEYAIRLEDGLLELLAWRGFAQPQEGRHPVFFFNACDIGQANRIANFVDGWAPAVLESGASAYIGGIWPLGDRGAAEFATRFYQLLHERSQSYAVPLTEVLRDARRLFFETHDPTYLAYVYYGDASFRVLKAGR